MAAPLSVGVGLTVPHTGEHAAPFCFNVQATPLFVTSFMTVAVNAGVVPIATVAGFGATDTEITGTVIVADLNILGSSTEVAVSVTSGVTGAFAGPV